MNAPIPSKVLNQHLIDPEICIRCNTCEETCPIDAISHDGNNYVVDPGICNHCMACVPPCPTGAIDNWVKVLSDQAHSLERSEEHTSELQSLMRISYAVFCLKKKKHKKPKHNHCHELIYYPITRITNN